MTTQLNPTPIAEEQAFLPFALPDIDDDEIEEVIDSLRSGWLTTGPKTKRFEQDFAAFIGEDVEALAVNSATSGLHLALEAVGVTAGDEVITTPYTFTASAEVIRYLGADPVFVDIDPTTLNIDVSRIEAAITPRTKAIIPVHFGGLSCEMQPLLEIARKHGLKVIEDAAHSLPTTYHGDLIGTLESDVTVYSFYATKTLATGEGGMIITRNPEIAARCKVMRLHGINRDAFDRYTSSKPSWHYDVVAPGFKYNMTDVAASLGIHQLRKLRRFQHRREQMARRYDEAFASLPVTLPPRALPGDMHAWHLYVVRLDLSVAISRDQFIVEMAKRGIGTSVHFIPLHLQPYWRDTYALSPSDFPCALAAYERAVSLPLYTKMTDGDQTRVIEAVRELLG
jgi:dTDP-4-amino-4,6-dideoxygalactose transaminase